MQFASEQTIPLLKAGEKKTFDVSATLDVEKLQTVTEKKVTQIKAEIAYDYIKGPYPATLEGAVRSGEEAIALLGST